MNFEKYSQLAIRTANMDADNLTNAALGLAGEAGEVADLVKKIRFQGHATDEAKLINEAGDILWYINLLAITLGISLEEIAERNISKLEKRYPEGYFSADRSVNRHD